MKNTWVFRVFVCNQTYLWGRSRNQSLQVGGDQLLAVGCLDRRNCVQLRGIEAFHLWKVRIDPGKSHLVPSLDAWIQPFIVDFPIKNGDFP